MPVTPPTGVGNGWIADTSPTYTQGRPVVLGAGNTGAPHLLTAAGIAAAQALVASYLTAAKVAAFAALGEQPSATIVTPTQIAYSVLPDDITGQIRALQGILQTAGNTT
jgi:hypothetical protein